MAVEARARVAVFASGTGTNFEAMMTDRHRNFDVVMLICDKPRAHVIGKAAGFGVETVILDPKTFPSKTDYEKEMITKLKRANVEWIILAGYMRIVGETLLNAYQGRIMNVHPSLLPSFPGKDAVGQALAAGVKVSGVTIHFVDEGVDTGPIIAQEPVTVFPNDTGDSLQKRIQQVEHVLYTRIINEVTKS
jgi:phosphoribosylglycinamide formyltransferase-1